MSKYLRQGAIFRMAKLRSRGYSPEEIGRAFGISAEDVNQLVSEREYQVEMSFTRSKLSTSSADQNHEYMDNRLNNIKEHLPPLPNFQGDYRAASNNLAEKSHTKSRNRQIAMLRREGHTLEEIGDKFNITRERVRQILSKNSKKIKVDLLSVSRAINILGCSRDAFLQLVESGVISPASGHGQRLLFRESDIKSTEISVKACVMCGQPIPRGRQRYCSVECFKERWTNYRYWSEERKEKHKKLVEKWLREHPEQAKMIQSRASYRYQRKKRKLQQFDTMVQDIILPRSEVAIDKSIEEPINKELQLHDGVVDKAKLNIYGYPSRFFFNLAHWAKERNKLNPWERSLMYDVGKYIAHNRGLSDRQERQAIRIIEKAERLGFQEAGNISQI